MGPLSPEFRVAGTFIRKCTSHTPTPTPSSLSGSFLHLTLLCSVLTYRAHAGLLLVPPASSSRPANRLFCMGIFLNLFISIMKYFRYPKIQPTIQPTPQCLPGITR